MAEQVSLPLACPRCATRYPLEERFCASCGMPLTYAGRVDVEEHVSGRREQARKVRPEYTHGDLRRAVTARQQPEAEFIQMLLLDEGIPSTVRRSAGFDVPDFLAAGPRDVLVPESALETARQILRQSDLEPSYESGRAPGAAGGGRSAAFLLLGILAVAALVALVILVLLAVLR
jgi:hypothetical protein